MTETLQLVERFINTHPINSTEVAIYDVSGGSRWTIFVSREHALDALEVFLTTERAIVSNIEVDCTGTKYILTIPYTIGAIRSGVYTYNAQKHVLE